jgi:hypothetical protein
MSAAVHLPLLPADAEAVKAAWLQQQQQTLQGRNSTSRTSSGSCSRADLEAGDVRSSPLDTPTRQHTGPPAAAFGSPLPTAGAVAHHAAVADSGESFNRAGSSGASLVKLDMQRPASRKHTW